MLQERAEPPALAVKGVTKAFGALIANDNIDLEVRSGEVVALLGENGAGKTTFLNILSGHYKPDVGEVIAYGTRVPSGSQRSAIAAGIGIVHQHYVLAENISVIENIVLGMQDARSARLDLSGPRQRIAELMAGLNLDIDLDQPVGRLSIGQRQRVEIVKALYRNARILVLDEPTSNLTPEESTHLLRALRRLAATGMSIIFVSHKLREVREVSERIVVLRRGMVVASFVTNDTTDDQISDAMIGGKIVKFQRSRGQPGQLLLELANVGITGQAGARLLQGVSLSVHAGEIVAIAGVAGNGQSSLAGLLSGELSPTVGTVSIAGTEVKRFSPKDMQALGIGSVPEDRMAVGMIGDMSVAENLASEILDRRKVSRFGLLRHRNIRAHAMKIIADYDVRCPGPDARTRLLSGGNIQKLLLARVLEQAPRLIVANQPTRGLDIGSAGSIHRRLSAARDAGAGVLVISDDLDEIMAISDRLYVAYGGTLSESLDTGTAEINKIGQLMGGKLRKLEVVA